FLSKPRVIRQGQPEVAGTHDRHSQLPIETENLSQMPLQVANVISNPTDAEFAEVREVLSNLRRVEPKLLGEGLRRNRSNAGVVQKIETSEVDRETVGGQFRNLLGTLPGGRDPHRRFVRRFHKLM